MAYTYSARWQCVCALCTSRICCSRVHLVSTQVADIMLRCAVLCYDVAMCHVGALEMESAVNQEMDPAVKQSLITHSKGWRGINNPWMADGDHDEEFQYINLVVNPERYTGYKVR